MSEGNARRRARIRGCGWVLCLLALGLYLGFIALVAVRG